MADTFATLALMPLVFAVFVIPCTVTFGVPFAAIFDAGLNTAMYLGLASAAPFAVLFSVLLVKG